MVLSLLLYYFSHVSSEWKTSTIRQSHRRRLFAFSMKPLSLFSWFSYGASDNVQPWQPSFFLSCVYSREKTLLKYKNYLLLFVVLRTCVVHHRQTLLFMLCRFCDHYYTFGGIFPYCNIKRLLIDLSICCYSSEIIEVSVLWFYSQNVYRSSFFL